MGVYALLLSVDLLSKNKYLYSKSQEQDIRKFRILCVMNDLVVCKTKLPGGGSRARMQVSMQPLKQHR